MRLQLVASTLALAGSLLGGCATTPGRDDAPADVSATHPQSGPTEGLRPQRGPHDPDIRPIQAVGHGAVAMSPSWVFNAVMLAITAVIMTEENTRANDPISNFGRRVLNPPNPG